jgi:hypothetical protein
MTGVVVFIGMGAFFGLLLLIDIIKPSRCRGKKGGMR